MNTATSPRSDTGWTPRSWRDRVALQQPQWPAADAHPQVLAQLGDLPPLVFAGEARELTEKLAAVSEGQAFLLQAGDCAESFDTSADSIRDRLRVILQMAVILTYYTGVPVVKVGRIAGQFAKPGPAIPKRWTVSSSPPSGATSSMTSGSRPTNGPPTRHDSFWPTTEPPLP